MSERLGENIKAVLFDHDDTLVSTLGPKIAQHKHTALTWYDRVLTDAQIHEQWGKPLPEMFRILYGTDDVDLVMERVKSIHHDFPKILLPATIPALQRIHDSDRITG